MSEADIRFYFDYVSPYSYFVWHDIHELAQRFKRRVEPVPVLFAGLLNAHGQLGPAEIPVKRSWLYKNVVRTAALANIPVEPPASHPFNPLLALRVSSLSMDDATRRELIDALFRAAWSAGLDVTDPKQVADIASQVGLDGQSAVADSARDEAKSRLRSQTESAIEAGVFGVPTLIVDGELFWGYDELPGVERFLAGDTSTHPEAFEAWAKLRPSSVRRRPES